jgi:hypothetical protein
MQYTRPISKHVCLIYLTQIRTQTTCDVCLLESCAMRHTCIRNSANKHTQPQHPAQRSILTELRPQSRTRQPQTIYTGFQANSLTQVSRSDEKGLAQLAARKGTRLSLQSGGHTPTPSMLCACRPTMYTGVTRLQGSAADLCCTTLRLHTTLSHPSQQVGQLVPCSLEPLLHLLPGVSWQRGGNLAQDS